MRAARSGSRADHYVLARAVRAIADGAQTIEGWPRRALP